MAKPTTAPAVGARSLNDLPEEILIHILSFLSTKYSIQTSLISRKWRNLWSQLPFLHFSYFHSSSATRSIADFVNQTLLYRSSTSAPLHKFHLEFLFREHVYSSHLDSWVRYAILHHVRELELDFFVNTEFQMELAESFVESSYNFPFFLLRNGCVEVLRLARCDITLPSNMSSMEIRSLRSIFLDQVYLNDKMVCDLISGSVNLELLSLEYCCGMKDVKICSLKLKELNLNYFNNDNGSVEISCPKLESLVMVGFDVMIYDMKDLSGLIEACVFFLHKWKYYGHWSQVVMSLAHVKRLTVQNWWFKLLAYNDAVRGSFHLHNLKHLELRTEYSKSDLLGVAELLKLSPNLETLILDYICKIDNDECLLELLNNQVDLMLPSLKQVKIKDYKEADDMVSWVLLFMKHAEVLEKIILVPSVVGENADAPTFQHSLPEQVKVFKEVGGVIIISI